MKFLAKIAIAVSAAGAVIGIYFIDESYTKKEEAAKAIKSKAFDFEDHEVRKVMLHNSAGTFAFERGSADAEWTMTQPRAAKSDSEAVNGLLATLRGVRTEIDLSGSSKATALSPEDLKKYGFEAPRLTVELTVEKKDKDKKDAKPTLEVQKFLVGGDFGIGSTSDGKFKAEQVYGLRVERNALVTISSSLLTSTKKSFADFRSKRVVDFKADDVKSFSLIHRGGETITLVKDDKGWKLTSPRDLKTDSSSVNLYLDRIASMKVEQVTEKEMVTPDRLSALGLDPEFAVLEVRGAENKPLQTLKFGITTTSNYVTMFDGAVGSFDLKSYPDFVPELKFFRDRVVLKGLSLSEISKIRTVSGKIYQKEGSSWYAASASAGGKLEVPQLAPAQLQGSMLPKDNKGTVEPTAVTPTKAADTTAASFFSQWEFLAGDDVIDNVKTTDFRKYGLDRPITKFAFLFSDEKKSPVEILVGNRVLNNEKMLYVKRSDAPEVYVVGVSWLELLMKLDGSDGSPTASPAIK